MKELLIACAVVALAYSQTGLEIQDLGSFSNEELKCIKEFNLNATKLTILLKLPYMPEHDVDFNKFTECTWKQQGLLDVKGDVIWTAFKFYVKGAYMDAVGIADLADFFAEDTTSHCKDVKGNSPGQIAVKLMNCIVKRLYS
ncbi:hypothetical protein FQA39_LY11744 [Lamprigera yunnana]|nr:hypothetical protein FQA39_LY11744 [Lamprigera yunnana]